MTNEEILALANAAAEIDDDMTEVVSGGGNYGKRFPEGWTVARFTSYIEKGKHIEEFKGKAKDPAIQFTLGFELYSPNYLNDDGTPYFIETFNIGRSRNEKARAFLTFKAMNYKGLAKNFGQLLNGVYLVQIKDYLSKAAKPGTEPKSVIGEIRAGIDVVTNKEYDCPPATSLFLFSWAKPTLEAWDSFHVEGTNDQGKSKNWKQEFIAGAVDFAGSPLEALLLTNGRPIPQGTPQKTLVGTAAPAGATPPAATGAAPAAAPATPNVGVAAPATSPTVAASPVAVPVPASAPVVAATPAPAVAPVVPVVPVAEAVAAPLVASPVV